MEKQSIELKNTEKINKECIVVDDLENAVNIAFKNALENDVILLSPACASWDQYSDFEERGRKFKEYVTRRMK